MGWGKVACWSTKAAISLIRVTFPDPLNWSPLPQYWGFATPTTSIAIISGTCEATDFELGRNIQRVHPNKSPLKILEQRERGVSRECPNFWGTPYYP